MSHRISGTFIKAILYVVSNKLTQATVLTNRKDAKSVKVKKTAGVTKFKIRCSRVSIIFEKNNTIKNVLFLFVMSQNICHPNFTKNSNLEQFLYTLKITDAEKAEKLTQSLPPGLSRTDI